MAQRIQHHIPFISGINAGVILHRLQVNHLVQVQFNLPGAFFNKYGVGTQRMR